MLRNTMYVRRATFWQVLVLLTCMILTAYFAYHAIYGRHGLEALKELKERSSLLDFEIKSLEAVRANLKHDVALLSPAIPDPDIVDEAARDILGYVRKDDRIRRDNLNR